MWSADNFKETAKWRKNCFLSAKVLTSNPASGYFVFGGASTGLTVMAGTGGPRNCLVSGHCPVEDLLPIAIRSSSCPRQLITILCLPVTCSTGGWGGPVCVRVYVCVCVCMCVYVCVCVLCRCIVYMAPFKVLWHLTLINIKFFEFLKSRYTKSKHFSTKTKVVPENWDF